MSPPLTLLLLPPIERTCRFAQPVRSPRQTPQPARSSTQRSHANPSHPGTNHTSHADGLPSSRCVLGHRQKPSVRCTYGR